MISVDVGCNLGLGTVTIGEQLLLVVQQLLARLGRVFCVLRLDNRVDRASLLAEAAVDALGHVNVVPCGPSCTILARLRLDRDGLSGADGLAELARDATFFAGGVSAEGVLATEARAKRTLLEGVHDRVGWAEEVLEYDPHAAQDFGEEKQLTGLV